MKIALVSDTHFSTTDTLLLANWEATERWLGQIKPDLCVHLGDITANGVHSAAELVHAQGMLGRTGSAIRFIPGNHDIGDHAAGPGLTTDTSFDSVRLAEYRDLFGMDRWSIRAGEWLLIGLNAPLMATGLAEEAIQLAWLEEALSQHAGPLGLFLHKPLFRDAPDENIVHTRYVPLAARERLLRLLSGHDLRFVAAGHTHQVRQIVVDGIEHVWAPSTAFILPDFRQERIGEKLVGVMLLEIDRGRHAFTHVIPAGMKSHDLMEFSHIYPALKTIEQS